MPGVKSVCVLTDSCSNEKPQLRANTLPRNKYLDKSKKNLEAIKSHLQFTCHDTSHMSYRWSPAVF